MKKQAIILALLLAVFLVPVTPASAATLTDSQVTSILSLLAAFGVDENTIENVRLALAPIKAPELTEDTPDIPIAPPVVGSGPLPPSEPAKITVKPRFIGQSSIAGSNCETIYYKVSVFDQYGKEMSAEVLVQGPNISRVVKAPGEFAYRSPSQNTTEAISLSAGNATANLLLTIEDGLQPSDIEIRSNERWYEKSGGAQVNPSTLLCL